MKYWGTMDQECIKLCDTINKLSGIKTKESCCGHGDDFFRIWFKVTKLDKLPVLLYFCDSCHVGFSWDCIVTTDCGMSPVTFCLRSKVPGEQAYMQANRISYEIEKFLKEERE